MADLPTLFSYEHAIETAWQSVLRANGSFNVYIEASDESKIAPYVDVILKSSTVYPSKERGHRHQTADGTLYFDMWHGHLVSTVYTVRGTNSDQQTAIIGTIRSLSVEETFNASILPYHDINIFEDAGTVRGIDAARLLDFSQISYLITFGIRPNAW